MTTRLTAVTVHQENLPFGGLYDPNGWVDSAGNTWDAYMRIGFSEQFQAAVIVRKVSPAGVVLADWEIVCPTTGAGVHKADGVGIYPSGDKLIVSVTGHSIGEWPRSMVLAKVAIPGFAPYHVGEMPAGKAGAFVPEGEPQPQEGGVTKDEVQAIVNAAVAQIKGQDNVNLKVVIDNILSKTKLGVEQLFDGANGSHVVYSQLLNTSFTGAKAALAEDGSQEGRSLSVPE